jgi:two-component system response regulator AtoC
MGSRHDDVLQTAGGRPPDAWLDDAIARDPVLEPIAAQLRRLGAGDAPVLISGEPGSGRELAARAIHNLSSRASHPFVQIDCSSLSEPLIEAELLGVGGQTGGPPYKMGIFEQAAAGTVFVAEVAELPLRGQDALLRLLERHEVVRLGSDAPVSAHARCIASTSVDLRDRVAPGLFRDELHGRLATELLVLPPLRERVDDITTLARHFLVQCCSQMTAKGDFQITPDAEAVLRAYSWPGNIRELREVIEQAALSAQSGRIAVENLPDRLRGEQPGGPLPSLRDVEMRHIERVLQEARGNQRRASRILGISRWSLSRRLRKYGMAPRSEVQQ